VVLVLVSPLLHSSLLSLPLEAKLSLVTILSTKVTMEPNWSRLGLEMRLLTRLLTKLVTFLLARFFSRFKKLVWLGCKLVLGCGLRWS
jgi:hypothetical protein